MIPLVKIQPISLIIRQKLIYIKINVSGFTFKRLSLRSWEMEQRGKPRSGHVCVLNGWIVTLSRHSKYKNTDKEEVSAC